MESYLELSCALYLALARSVICNLRVRLLQEFWAVWNAVPQPSELLDGKRLVREGRYPWNSWVS